MASQGTKARGRTRPAARRARSAAAKRSAGRRTRAAARRRRGGSVRAAGVRPQSRNGSATRRIRYAVVGLGHIAQAAVLPAFQHARSNSTLAALVSDDPLKLRRLGRRYGVERLFAYDQYDECLASGEIDAVYIALPNHLHREYVVRAARAGVHVLCEKPLALSAGDCRAMIEAAEEARVRLMVAYRLHFDPSNLEAVRLIQSGALGEVRLFGSLFSMQVRSGDIRLRRETGGGTLWDIGIYCINAARYLFRSEPAEVFAFGAHSGDERFREVDEMTGAVLSFPGGRLATFITSFGAADAASFEVVGTRGTLRVENAYEYATERRHVLRVGERTRERRFGKRDQFAPELLHFSDCILEGREPGPSGEEGLVDVQIIEALYRSAEIGRPVPYEGPERRRRPTPAQKIERPAVPREPELVRTQSPTRD